LNWLSLPVHVEPVQVNFKVSLNPAALSGHPETVTVWLALAAAQTVFVLLVCDCVGLWNAGVAAELLAVLAKVLW
jgi:hypothetical protein